MTTKLEQDNIIHALKGEEITKICIQCIHYDRAMGHERCTRSRNKGFHSVTGKIQVIGEMLYCNVEREIDQDYPYSVKSGTTCGAIGQFWEQRSTPWTPWYIFWRR